MAVASYETYLQNVKNQMAEKRQAAIDTANKVYQNQAAAAQESYDAQIKDTTSQYDDLYRNNAVQKAINERQIAENMANMGLTDSGLNRTQITANQISYANTKGEIDQNKQKAVDSLALALRQSLTDIENNRLSEEYKIGQSYDSLEAEQATNLYNADVEAETARQKAALEAETERYKAYYESIANAKPSNIINSQNGVLNAGYQGTLSANKVTTTYNDDGSVTYFDRVTGQSSTFAKGVNPYTNTTNKDVKYGTFSSNGYQPDNIYGVKLKDTGKKIWVDERGANYKVFTAAIGVETLGNPTSVYVVWDREFNAYVGIDPETGKRTGLVYDYD